MIQGNNWTEAKKIRITPDAATSTCKSCRKSKTKESSKSKEAPWDKKKEQTEAFDFR